MNEEETKGMIKAMLNCDSEEFYKKYRKYKKAEEEFRKVYEPFKENLVKLYSEKPELTNNILIGGLKLVYISPSVRTSIDSKKLKEEEPELAKKFTKTTNVAATIRLEEV